MSICSTFPGSGGIAQSVEQPLIKRGVEGSIPSIPTISINGKELDIMKKHSIIIGQVGCGKSLLCSNLIAEDIEYGLKVLIIENLNEYNKKFHDDNTASFNYQEDYVYNFNKKINIININTDRYDYSEKSSKLHLIIKNILVFAVQSGIDVVYIEDTFTYWFLENLYEFLSFRQNFNIVAVTQNISVFKPVEIKKFFNEFIVMETTPYEVDNLVVNYGIRKNSLNKCLQRRFRSFKIFEIQ